MLLLLLGRIRLLTPVPLRLWLPRAHVLPELAGHALGVGLRARKLLHQQAGAGVGTSHSSSRIRRGMHGPILRLRACSLTRTQRRLSLPQRRGGASRGGLSRCRCPLRLRRNIHHALQLLLRHPGRPAVLHRLRARPLQLCSHRLQARLRRLQQCCPPVRILAGSCSSLARLQRRRPLAGGVHVGVRRPPRRGVVRQLRLAQLPASLLKLVSQQRDLTRAGGLHGSQLTARSRSGSLGISRTGVRLHRHLLRLGCRPRGCAGRSRELRPHGRQLRLGSRRARQG